MQTVAAELFHADRRKDRTKVIIAFCNFAKAPNNTFYGDRISAPAVVNLVSATVRLLPNVTKCVVVVRLLFTKICPTSLSLVTHN